MDSQKCTRSEHDICVLDWFPALAKLFTTPEGWKRLCKLAVVRPAGPEATGLPTTSRLFNDAALELARSAYAEFYRASATDQRVGIKAVIKKYDEVALEIMQSEIRDPNAAARIRPTCISEAHLMKLLNRKSDPLNNV